MFAIWVSRGLLVLAGILSAGAAQSASLVGCVASVEAMRARIVRVEETGTLTLADGRSLVLEGILLPLGPNDRASRALQNQVIAALRALTHNRGVMIASDSAAEDRYGRIRGQVFLPQEPGGIWLQIALLRRGLARVDIAPDARGCASEFYAAEREARARHAGIWALEAYAIRTPNGLFADTGTFQIVEGTVVQADLKGGRVYLDFGADWRRDFTVTISPEDMRLFREAGVDPRGYAGKQVRVRGWIQRMHGPEIELADPEGIEVLSGTTN